MRRILKLFIAAVGLAFIAPLSAQDALIWNGFDLNNRNDVLKLQQDSRWVRELNKKGTEVQKKVFQDTLGAMQQKANDAALEALQNYYKDNPRFEGVTWTHDEFSTPGADESVKIKINTDYDVRFGYTDSRGNFIEVGRKVAEDAFYKSWSQQTGGPPPNADLNAHMHHAEKSRFLVTDRLHMEAPKEFTDQPKPFSEQNSKAVSNFTKVKAGQASLLDPEDLGRVYHEKADEQFRQARAIEQQLKNDSSLTEKQQTKLEEKMQSHQAEGVMQANKAIKALDASRASYARQGYKVGRIPDSLRSQMDAVLSFEGTKSDDVDAMMKRLGGADMADGFNQKVSSQIESLKWPKKNPSPPKSSGLATQLKGGSAAGMLGDVLSIEQRLKQAEQGSNWFLNFEEGDSEAEKKAKAVAIAAAELLPHGPTDLMDRGFTVDEKIKSIIELRVKQSKPISNAEIGVLVVGGAMVETTKRLIVDPVKPIAELTKEIFWDSPRDALDRMKEASNRQASEDLVRETHTAALAFQNMIDLGAIEATRVGSQGLSRHFSGFDVSPEDMLVLEIAGNSQWDNSLIVQWAIKDANKSVIASPEAKTVSDPSSLRIQLASTFLKRLSPGQYTAQVNISDPVSGRTAYERHEFAIGDYFAFGSLQVLDDADQPRTSSLKPGDRLKVTTARQGNWDDRYLIEWFFNGEKIKEVSASDSTAHYMITSLDSDIKGEKEIAVRAVDPHTQNWKVAYQSLKISITPEAELSEFQILSFKDKVGGAVLDGAVRNGQVIAFAASVPSEGSKEEPFIGDLTWQLFDPSGQPIEGIKKHERKIERGEMLKSTIRFSGQSLANGVYTLTLTHSDANDHTRRYQAQASIELFEPVWVTDIWATKTKGGESPETSFKTGDEIFLYASFEVGEGVTELERMLLVRDAKTGDIVAQVKDRFTPKVASGADRTAIKLARNQFKAGDTLEFVASLAGGGESPVERRVTFNLEAYKIAISSPQSLHVGDSGAFSLKLPADFRPPYSIDLDADGLLVTGLGGTSLSGTISAPSSMVSGPRIVFADVMDAEGRSGSASTRVTVEDVPPVKAENAYVGQCNTLYDDGGDEPEQYTVTLPSGFGGGYSFWSEHFSVKDRMIVFFNGSNIYDTGCTGEEREISLSGVYGGGQVRIVVEPNCDGTSGTSWKLELKCR